MIEIEPVKPLTVFIRDMNVSFQQLDIERNPLLKITGIELKISKLRKLFYKMVLTMMNIINIYFKLMSNMNGSFIVDCEPCPSLSHCGNE